MPRFAAQAATAEVMSGSHCAEVLAGKSGVEIRQAKKAKLAIFGRKLSDLYL